MKSFILFVLFFCISDSESVKMLKNVAVKSGGSITIPCFYDEKYKSNRKYWCKGTYWTFCRIVASTNTSGRTSVTDYPTQNMFTVELNSLQDSDSDTYWCAVEIGGRRTPDEADYLYLTVSADPVLSVRNSRLSGQEGGSMSVQCFYRDDYNNTNKQWCRFKDWNCYEEGKNNTCQNSAVMVIEYGRGYFTVEMTGLQKSDAGWYWFSANDVGVPVYLTVTERPSTTTALTTSTTVVTTTVTTALTTVSTSQKNITKGATTDSTAVTQDTPTKTTTDQTNMLVWILLAVGLCLLLILVSVTTCMLRKKNNGNQLQTSERRNTAVHTNPDDCVLYSTVKPKNKVSTSDDSVLYSTVKPKNKSSTEVDLIYASVATTTRNNTRSPPVEDDNVIYSSVVHK